MVTFRRAVVLSVLLLLTIFFLYPRRPSTALPTPKPHTGVTAKSGAPAGEAGVSTAQLSSGLLNGKKADSAHSPELATAKKQQQIAIANIENLPVAEQLAYHFPYDVLARFPAYIWQTWKYTPASAQFSEKFRVTEASWTEKHPEFVHEVITDTVALHLIKHLYSPVPEVLEAYQAMPLPILKADFFRYLILLARGGIYADIDTLALKPAIDWIPTAFKTDTVGLVIGIEADPDRPDWADWYSRRIQFCQWTIQAKPGHPVLREVVAGITGETLRRKKQGTLKANHDSVVTFTGPAVWTDAIFEYFNDARYFDMSNSQGNISWANFTGMTESRKVGDVVVLPITSFSPGIGHSGAKDIDDEMAFVKHDFEGSWKPEKERNIHPASGKNS